MKSEGSETDVIKHMHQSTEGMQACSEPFCCKTSRSDVNGTPQLETLLKEITSSDTGLSELKTATLIVQCNRPKSGTVTRCGQQKQVPQSSRTLSELMKVHVDYDFRRTFIQKHVSSTRCFYDPTGRYSTTGELVTNLKPDVIETSAGSELSANRLEFSTDGVQPSYRIDNFHTQPLYEQSPHRLYDQAGRIRWSADSRWCPIRGRLQLRNHCRSARSNELHPHLSGSRKTHANKRRVSCSAEENYHPHSEVPNRARHLLNAQSRHKTGIHSFNTYQDLTQEEALWNQLRHELTTQFCYTCGLYRVHLFDQCFHCKRSSPVSPTIPQSPLAIACSKINTTELLTRAATGLRELAHCSSDEDDDQEQDTVIRYDSVDVEQRTKVNAAQRSFSENRGPTDFSTSQHSPSNSDQNSMTSRFTYTMEEPGELMERLAQFEQHMDQLYSLSNSGSFASESSKRTNPTAYTRPKLPANLTRRQQSEPQHGRIFAVRQDVSGTNVPEHSLVSARSEKLSKDIANEQKLIAQLELRSLSKNGHSEYETCGDTSLPAHASVEDQEVARALMGAENSPNVNRRLIAMLQRRNLSQLTHSSTAQKLDLSDSDQIERFAKRGHSHIITELGVPPRTQSQQPMHRTRDTPDTVRRDASLGMTRTSNNFRAQTSVESSSEAHTNRHIPTSNMRSKSQGSKSPLSMNTDMKRSGVPNRLLRSASQRSHPTPADSTKLSALLNWQRRKAYDPQLSMNSASSKDSPRSPYNSIQEDESPRVSHTKCLQIGRVKENGARESSRRSTTANRRTAPVETADCLAALQTIQAQNHYPPHCSVIPKLFAALPKDRNADDSRKSTFRSQSEASNGHMARATNGQINGEHRIDADKKRHSRTASVNREEMSTSTQEPAVIAHVTKRETSDLTKKIGRKSNLPSVRSTKVPDNLSKRSTSQTGYRNNGSSQTIRQLTNPSGVPDHWTYIDKDQNYPDIAVESIRYKIEKLTNFIVRLRKRIERDYAEQGTCSPGDDVFGDEAVGATIAGQSTGMHPVVAASLKNLRILEFNAQEIFNLLYPTEVDFWESERACLTGDIEDERTYNEERSKLTDILSSRIDQNEENNFINNRIRLPFRTERDEGIPTSAMSTDSTEIRIPTDDGDVI